MWTIKTFLGVSLLLLKIVIVSAESHTFIEAEPVFWYDSDDLVYDEYVNINLDVKILSPCDLKAFPPGFNKSQQEVDKLRLECSKNYHEMFLLPLTGQFQCGYKERENTPINTGNKTIIVKLALLVGYGSIYSFSSINKNVDISKMKLEQMANKTEVEREELVKMVESKLLEQGSFADLFGLPEITNWSWKDFLHSRFKYGWDKTRIHEDFLHVIGIEDFRKAFGNVLLEPARNFGCSLDESWTNIKVTFTLPKLNNDLRLFYAEPFRKTESFEDYICDLEYNGPERIVWSTEQNCVVAKESTERWKNTIWNGNGISLYTESNTCIPMSNEDTPYFAVSVCYRRRTWQPDNFFGHKVMNGSHYLYCPPDGYVHFHDEDSGTPCPPFVFRVNSSSRFSFGHLKDEPTIHHEHWKNIDVVPASVSQIVNRMLFPGGLNKSVMSEMPIRNETIFIEIFGLPPGAITVFIIIGVTLLAMISAALVHSFRKFGFAVPTKVNKVAFYKTVEESIQSDNAECMQSNKIVLDI